jgi:nucleoside-diphosphate-sugar epimerase
MKNKLFITGISSELIQNLIPLIATSKYEVTGLHHGPISHKINNIKYVQGDLNRPESYLKNLEGTSTILHAGGITHSNIPSLYYKVNYEATRKLIEVSKNKNVRRFIYISSFSAGEKSGDYGRSKFLAEKYLEDNFPNWLIIRPSEIFGLKKNEGIEQLIRKGFLSSFHLCPIGMPQKLKPIYVNDVSTYIYSLLINEAIREKKIDLIGKEEYSIKEILKLIETYKNRQQHLFYIPKIAMKFIYILIKQLPISLGIAPDQILRLYRPKNQLLSDKEIRGQHTLKGYLNHLSDFSKTDN